MFKSVAWSFALVLVVGCGAEEGAYVGTYDVKGTWKLSGPFEAGKSVGESARDLVLDKLVGSLPAPSFVESKVKSYLEGNIGDTIKTTVDGAMPPSFAPGGTLTVLLGQTLAAVEVDSTLVLDGEKEGDLEGTETVFALRYALGGKTYTVQAADLTGANITAQWKGEETRVGTLSIEKHGVKIGYGALVRQVLSTALDAADLSALEAQVTSVFDCKNIVSAIVGNETGLKISVVGWSHTIGSSDLEGVCNSALSSLSKKTLGQFELDSGVEVGGGVSWQEDASGVVTLQSNTFGGTLAILPEPIAPKVSVSFTGERQPSSQR